MLQVLRRPQRLLSLRRPEAEDVAVVVLDVREEAAMPPANALGDQHRIRGLGGRLERREEPFGQRAVGPFPVTLLR